MDTMTAAFITTALANGLGNLWAEGVKASYQTLKALLQKKFNRQAALMQSLEGLEQKPNSEGRKMTLNEELTAVGADKDAEILAAAKALLAALESLAEKKTVSISVQGGRGHGISGTGSVTVMNFSSGTDTPRD
jgi:hypothetical protein